MTARLSVPASVSGVRGSLAALVCSLIVALAAPAWANDHEVVFATGRTELHVRPGEAAPVVGHTDEGDELEVLGDQGRWLRVRNGKQIGWLTRTEVSTMKPAEPRRSQRSGFSGKPVSDAVKVTIEIDRVRGFDDPRTKAKNVIELVRGEVVSVIGRGHDGWILVEGESGAVGWIPASVVSDAGKFADDPRRAPSEIEKPAPAAAPPTTPAPVVVARRVEPRERSRMSVSLLATGGLQTFKMAQSGEGDPSLVATGALATIVAGARLRLRGSLWVGLGTTAEMGAADLTYYAPAASKPMPTKELGVDAYGEFGIGTMPYVAFRGGIHYATLSVETDRNDPMLLGERIAGATAGLGGALPLTRWLSLSATVDIMPAGAQKLSRLPPGTLYATTVWGAWARGTLAMPLPAHLMAALSYQFGAVTAELTDNAAMPKTASRTDQSHEFTAGLGVTW